MLVTDLNTKLCKACLDVMGCQTMLAGMKVSITGTENSHEVNTGRYPIIPCLLSLCFDDAMHGRYASFYVNKGIRNSIIL